MAGNKKKKSSTLILLLIVMVAMIVAIFWLTNYKNDQADSDSTESTEEATEIVSIDEDALSSIYFKNADGEMTLVKDSDGNWTSAEDEALPVNQTNAAAMAAALTSLTASNTIKESAEELSGYGLDAPAVQVVAALEDGTKTSIAVGNATPLSDGYYATVNDDGNIYVIASSFYSSFTYSPSQMVTVETIPTVTAEYVTYLLVENKDKPNFEVNYDESKASDYSGLNFWTIKQPYATEVPGNADNLTTLFGNYAGLSFLACVEYDAQDLSIYGLDDPVSTVSLKYYEVYTKDTDSSDSTDSGDASQSTSEAETTKVYDELELLIGAQDAEGNYYVKLQDSQAVNTMSADTVSTITDIDAYSNASHTVSLVNISSVSSLDIVVGGKTYTMSIEEAADTSEEESIDESTTEYYFNGKKAEESGFKDLYQEIIGITTEKDIPEDYFNSNPDKTPYMTLNFHLNTGETVTVKYLVYNDSYYVVDLNGIEYFLTDLRGVNKLAASLAAFETE